MLAGARSSCRDKKATPGIQTVQTQIFVPLTDFLDLCIYVLVCGPLHAIVMRADNYGTTYDTWPGEFCLYFTPGKKKKTQPLFVIFDLPPKNVA